MMGLTLALLVHGIFIFAFMNLLFVLKTSLVVLKKLLVVSVVWGLEFFF